MERLTNGVDYCQLQCDFGKDRCFFQDQSKCYENNMYNKLREYEIAEEQGLLLRLPCKVGDTVYCLTSADTTIVECEILWIEKHKKGVMVFALDGGLGDVVLAKLGKNWFLTYEEAEIELANRLQSHAEAIIDERNGRINEYERIQSRR